MKALIWLATAANILFLIGLRKANAVEASPFRVQKALLGDRLYFYRPRHADLPIAR